MPLKYRNKEYRADSYYHIYNKGIDGRKIFEGDDDYLMFENLLETYTTNIVQEDGPYKTVRPSVLLHQKQMNLTGNLEIVAYCLMPDHFHLLVHQMTPEAITKLMRRVNTGYVMKFNRRHKRKGTLFESNYRAVRVEGQETLLHLSKFIHLNPVTRVVKRFGPVETVTGTRPEEYLYSSYSHYIGLKDYKWIHMLEVVKDPQEYRRFSEDARDLSEKYLAGVTIDENE